MGHVFSFMPLFLEGIHVYHVSTWVGILSSITFVVGLPLVPMWGVWANRYGGKMVIIRSAYVEMVVLLVLGASHSLSTVFVAMALVGFQLGNTGVMLSSLRSLVPGHRIGFAISLFSISSPIGAALGPLLGGWLLGSHVVTIHGLYFLDGGLSFLTGTMLWLGYRESFRTVGSQMTLGPRTSIWRTAGQSIRYTFGLKITWTLFGIYTALMMARQMVNPYVPIAIEHLRLASTSVSTAIGWIVGLATLFGALLTMAAGRLGDKLGFTKILCCAFCIGIPVTPFLGMVHGVLWFGVCLALFIGAITLGGAMIFSLFSTQIPETHRSTALNLVYLPMYVGGIIGPAISSLLLHVGLYGPFLGAGCLLVLGILLMSFTVLRQKRH